MEYGYRMNEQAKRTNQRHVLGIDSKREIEFKMLSDYSKNTHTK